MRTKDEKISDEEQASLDQGWEEIGESLAAAIVEGQNSFHWAWALISPLGIYERWMLSRWVARYQKENANRLNKLKANRKQRRNLSTLNKYK